MKFNAVVMYHKYVTSWITWLIVGIEWTAVCLISFISVSRVKVEECKGLAVKEEKELGRGLIRGGEGF